MTKVLNIPIILGASRPGRQSAKVAKFIHQTLAKFSGVTTSIVDVNDFDIGYDEEKSVPEFNKIIKKADALVIVFPEYNHGYPGKLKTLLDTEFDVYKHKPVALASVSSGQFGGARAVEALIPVLTDFKMIVTGLNLHFPNIKDVFNEDGIPVDSATNERVEKTLKELIYLTRAFQAGKQSVSLS